MLELNVFMICGPLKYFTEPYRILSEYKNSYSIHSKVIVITSSCMDFFQTMALDHCECVLLVLGIMNKWEWVVCPPVEY
jgi:hypothetical protein